MKRTSTVTWQESEKKGKYIHSLPNAPHSRVPQQQATKPEELIAAAHAGCFTMKLSFLVGQAGYTAQLIETTSEVTLEDDSISQSHLTVKAVIPGMSEQKFVECAVGARDDCPVSKALNLIISMDARLA